MDNLKDMGFNVKGGRMINDSENQMTGIQKASKLRKAIKRAEKVRMIAEGNELANANIDLFKKL